MSTPRERPAALPARMSLVTEAFHAFEVAVLPFPFMRAVTVFQQGLAATAERLKVKGWGWKDPAWRQLNNFMLACAPTLTHGFERNGYDDIAKHHTYRALAVGTPDTPLCLPDPAHIHLLIQLWAREWTETCKDKGADDLCRCFLDAIAEMPADWQWQTVTPRTLAHDVYAENSLGFQAVPALLATLLHGKTSVIHGGHGPQEIRWRKVQGNGSGPTGLYVVSQPFRASYTDDHGNFKEGYFAYRLDFRPQTQAGRFHTNDTDKKPVMKPWVFLDVSCQRYAHEPLVTKYLARNVSFLAGERADASLRGCPDDGTLVRLTAGYDKGSIVWRHQLPRLLAELRAKELPAPQDIFDNPAAFGNLNSIEDWKRQEYLLVTATGYEFGDNPKQGHQHSIKTGYSLRERGNVIARVLDLLEDVLVPDGPLEQDSDTPAGIKAPLILRDFKWLSARQQKYQPTVVEAVERAMGGATMHLFVLWREALTREQMQAQLRNAFLLGEGDPFPPNVHVKEIFINDAALLSPLPAAAITPDSDRPTATSKASEEDGEDSDDNEDDGDNGDNEANENDEDNLNPTSNQRAERDQKLRAWRNFLSAHVPASSSTRLAFIEISPRTKATAKNAAALNLHGIIREACARESIGSQMVQTVLPRDFAPDKKDATKPHILKSATKGRVLNAALDITHRHIGALYGRLPKFIRPRGYRKP